MPAARTIPVLGVFMDKDNRLYGMIEDLYSLCERRSMPVFSSFLDLSEQAALDDAGLIRVNSRLFGGHEQCERKMLGVFPDWQEKDDSSYPIVIVTVSYNYKTSLSHRDYLGTLMGMGIDRSKIGDILVYERRALMLVSDSLADYIASNLNKIGNVGVKAEVSDLSGFEFPERKFKEINAVAASLRLDAVLAAALNVSRKISAELIKKEKVSLNHRLCTDTSKKAAEGDILSVRGYGRYIFSAAGDTTRSDRIHITVKKYL